MVWSVWMFAMPDLTLPLKNPVLIFSLVLFIILFAPLILNRLRIPHIIGLIFSGVIIGPHGLNLMLRDSSIVLFGTVGLQYIMFMAGLEMNMTEFRKSKTVSLGFGLMTFAVPMLTGFAAGFYLLNFGFLSSLLLGGMLASHTLVAYPIASRFGITKNKSVAIAIGGTLVTDVLSLLVLAAVSGVAHDNAGRGFWIQLAVSIMIFASVVLVGFPFLIRWFFKKFEDPISQYIFVLAIVFFSCFLAELAGVEAIIGAFLAGLTLNRFIPHTSPLMNRIEFVGHSLFIPFFLIGVGMLVDLRVLLSGYEALLVALLMIVLAVASKYVAAWGTQKAFNMLTAERDLIFGLSTARVGATLATVLVGYNIILGTNDAGEPIRLLNEDVLNGSILMILVTCTVSSFMVERAARTLALREEEGIKTSTEHSPERILIPLANPDTIESLIALALCIKDPKEKIPIYVLNVVDDYSEAGRGEKANRGKKMLEQAEKLASAADQPVEPMLRYDYSVTSGMIHSVREKEITSIILGFHQKSGLIDSFLGAISEKVLKNTDKMVLLYKYGQPINTVHKVVLVVPDKAEYEAGFGRWIDTLVKISSRTGSKLFVYGSGSTLQLVKKAIQGYKDPVQAEFHLFAIGSSLTTFTREVKNNDLIVIISARMGTLSYHPALLRLPVQFARRFSNNSLIIIYPEQLEVHEELSYQYIERSPL